MLVAKKGPNNSGNSVRTSIRRDMRRQDLQGRATNRRRSAATRQPAAHLFLLFLGRRRRSGRNLGLARLWKPKHLVFNSALFQEGRNRLGRDRAFVEPVATAIELGDKLLGLILLARVVISEQLNDAAIARRARINRGHAEKRRVLPTHSLHSELQWGPACP